MYAGNNSDSHVIGVPWHVLMTNELSSTRCREWCCHCICCYISLLDIFCGPDGDILTPWYTLVWIYVVYHEIVHS